MFDTNIGFGYALISSILRILPEKAAFFRFKTQPERERDTAATSASHLSEIITSKTQ